MTHFDQLGILHDSQHGFRKGCSCESQLILAIHDLPKGLDDGSQIDAVLLDFSKAFDKVPHQRLLHKLSLYDVRGDICEIELKVFSVKDLLHLLSQLSVEFHKVQSWGLYCSKLMICH